MTNQPIGRSLLLLAAIGLALAPFGVAANDDETVCHVPPEEPEDVQTISVTENDLQTHLDHGDSLGACVESTPFECPQLELKATANGDGSITLNFTELETTAYLIRSDGDDSEVIAELSAGATTYTDADTAVDVTYAYSIEVEGELCALLEITSIPVFPTAVAGTLAMGASLLGYAGVRRFR